MSRHSIHLTDKARETIGPDESMSATINDALIYHARRRQQLAQIAAHWENEVVNNRNFPDGFPYKIETDQYRQIVLSQQTGIAKGWQTKAVTHLGDPAKGMALFAWPTLTLQGVKIPDIAWINRQTWQTLDQENPLATVPEICIEISSRAFYLLRLAERTEAYFEAGAREVWLIGTDGRAVFLTPKGPAARSALFPDFPEIIEA